MDGTMAIDECLGAYAHGRYRALIQNDYWCGFVPQPNENTMRRPIQNTVA
jgi:hypothetical protein